MQYDTCFCVSTPAHLWRAHLALGFSGSGRRSIVVSNRFLKAPSGAKESSVTCLAVFRFLFTLMQLELLLILFSHEGLSIVIEEVVVMDDPPFLLLIICLRTFRISCWYSSGLIHAITIDLLNS